MSIVITGSSGFVGSNLVPYLEDNGAAVISWGREEILRFREIEILRHDHRRSAEQELDGVSAIIHLAGKAHDLKQVSRPIEYFEVNTEITLALFSAFLNSKAKQFVYMSSVKAAADQSEDWLTEETPPNPQTPYGLSKLLAEIGLISLMANPAQKIKELINELKSSFRSCFPEPNSKKDRVNSRSTDSNLVLSLLASRFLNLREKTNFAAKVNNHVKELFILRPCMIHGPGNKGNLNLLNKFVQIGLPWPLTAFQNQRSFLSVSNLCAVIYNITEGKLFPGLYHVADNPSLSTLELIELLGECQGKKVRTLKLPKSIIEKIAWFGTKTHLPLNENRLEKLTSSYLVSTTKLTSQISLPLNSVVGLKNTFCSNGN